MTPNDCPELEVLFDDLAEGGGPALEHARGCDRCAAVLEDHRQLEKDLFRLADPMPPPDFVNKVMAKVAAAPAPVRSETKIGLAILAGALALGAASFVLGDGNPASYGVKLAAAFVQVKNLVIALGSGLGALWSTAAGPLTGALFAMLLLSLFGLRKVSP